MNFFQTILLIIFGAAAVLGTILFSGYFDKNQSSVDDRLLIWGTLPQQQIDNYLDELNKQKIVAQAEYRYVPASSFDQDLVEALAEGKGPDLIFLTQDLILRHQSKVARVSYETVPLRTFQDTFAPEGQLYADTDGIVGLPLLIDPLVLYWNQDLFTNAELAQPPRSWEAVLGIAERLTKRDERGNITQSAIALGGFSNIRYAKEMLATLFLQAEEPLVVRDASEKVLRVELGSKQTGTLSGGEAALQFFSEFSNPVKPDVYTWNSALKMDTELFKESKLALYVAPFSDLATIKADNSHLQFDIVQLPQRESGSIKATFGTVYAIAPLKSARNVDAATLLALTMTQQEQVAALAKLANLPPARRDLLSKGVSDPSAVVAYRSAIIARGWLDPSPAATKELFRRAVEAVISGVSSAADAISKLEKQLQDLL